MSKPAKPSKPQSSQTVLRVTFPDQSIKSFQIPPEYKLSDACAFLIKEKLDFGAATSGQEFQLMSLSENGCEVLDQELTPTQVAEQTGRSNMYLRRFLFLRDAKKFNPSIAMSAFDSFMLAQLQMDYLNSRVIYPVKHTATLSMLIMADRLGKFDSTAHASVLSAGISDYLPAWADDIRDWSKKCVTGKDLTLIKEFANINSQNYEELFKAEIVQQWQEFSKLYNAEEISQKAKAKFFEFAMSPEFELCSQIQAFRVRYSGKAEDMSGEVYIGFGPMGMHFFDREGLFTKYCYQLHAIEAVQLGKKQVIIKTDDELEHQLDTKDGAEIKAMVENYQDILMQMGLEDAATI
ncbi:FERM_domain [Hexamita inflata]|uniref:FERM domain n=1 Tax=Hexamita inflata TaxID=28002 RepID=A0AA86RDQ9_9EUKA|nr:FERM domain [Hexamita inflata]CAI9919639.1 FERM domain [Hexamita inflata]CAI9976379.1 FERM domain [Hexamita inflata]